MRVLVVGAGGVGAAIVSIAARRPFFEHLVVADIDLDRARRAAAHAGDPRISASPVGASDQLDVLSLIRDSRRCGRQRLRSPVQPTDLRRRLGRRGHLPRHGDASLGAPPDGTPTNRSGGSLGEPNSPRTTHGSSGGQLAIVGMGVEPGLSDVFARHAADHLFSRIDELNVRDGANLNVGGYDAPRSRSGRPSRNA
ncbi:MAG: saccharopine dehydrogenase NADP-binding domain-containing protein [Ilumatobacteraceae bacterium]